MPEGRIDAAEDAIEIVTIHSAKGLEWPVVIPINSTTELYRGDQFVHRQSDNTLHWMLGRCRAAGACGGACRRRRRKRPTSANGFGT